MQDTNERLMALEMAVAHNQKVIDEINEVVIEQGKKIDALVKRNMDIIAMLNEGGVKALADETPPPHY